MVDGCIMVLRFASSEAMNPMLDPISDRVVSPEEPKFSVIVKAGSEGSSMHAAG